MARVFIFDLFENHGLWKMIVGENANFSQQLLTSSSPSKSSTSSSSKPSSTSSTKSSSSSSKSSTSYKGDKHTQINKLIILTSRSTSFHNSTSSCIELKVLG